MRPGAIASMIVNPNRHAAQPHLGQSADERVVKPIPAGQPAVDPLHRAALVVVVLPVVAGARHRREHAPIFLQLDAHRGGHRTLLTLAGDPRIARRAAVLERVAVALEAAVVHGMHLSGPRTHAGDLAVIAVDHVLLTVHQLGAHPVLLRVTVLPAVANADDRLDLMLIPQPLDQFAVVVALVGAQALALLQQVRVPFLQLIKQQLCYRLPPEERPG